MAQWFGSLEGRSRVEVRALRKVILLCAQRLVLSMIFIECPGCGAGNRADMGPCFSEWVGSEKLTNVHISTSWLS
jgi:hypothetical protein